MIRHHAFFETLGSLDEKTPEWISAFAGLSVMRTVDRLAEEGNDRNGPNWSDLNATRGAIEGVSIGDPIRASLFRLVESMSLLHKPSKEVGADLMVYGRALDLEASWALASDVFATTSRIFSDGLYPRIVIEASIALGASARSAGDWDSSGRAYTQAEHLAARIGDAELGLTAQVGMAGSEMMKGNLPSADFDLEAILREAGRLGSQRVEALALHAKASVAHLRSNYQQAIHFAYRSLELTASGSARERILADIAAAYAGLGMRATARDGYSIVAMTSPNQWVRWQATLNLMELAIEDGDQAGFRDYMKQMESVGLGPRLRAYFLFFQALGCRRFEARDNDAEFEMARDYADSHRLHQIAFQIDQAMAAPVLRSNPSESDTPPMESGDELSRIAKVIGHLRENASV